MIIPAVVAIQQSVVVVFVAAGEEEEQTTRHHGGKIVYELPNHHKAKKGANALQGHDMVAAHSPFLQECFEGTGKIGAVAGKKREEKLWLCEKFFCVWLLAEPMGKGVCQIVQGPGMPGFFCFQLEFIYLGPQGKFVAFLVDAADDTLSAGNVFAPGQGYIAAIVLQQLSDFAHEASPGPLW